MFFGSWHNLIYSRSPWQETLWRKTCMAHVPVNSTLVTAISRHAFFRISRSCVVGVSGELSLYPFIVVNTKFTILTSDLENEAVFVLGEFFWAMPRRCAGTTKSEVLLEVGVVHRGVGARFAKFLLIIPGIEGIIQLYNTTTINVYI